jgi:hypothetical protein
MFRPMIQELFNIELYCDWKCNNIKIDFKNEFKGMRLVFLKKMFNE